MPPLVADPAEEFAKLPRRGFDDLKHRTVDGMRLATIIRAWTPVGAALLCLVEGSLRHDDKGQRHATIRVTNSNDCSVDYEYSEAEFGANYRLAARSQGPETGEYVRWMKRRWARQQNAAAKGAADLLKAKRKGGTRSSLPTGDEKYSPDFKAGDFRRHFELDRKLFFDVEIVKATRKTITHRGIGAPEAYTFETPRELFIKQLAEACYRETGDDLKAGKILEALEKTHG